MANVNVEGIDLTTGQSRPLAVGDTPTDSSGNSVAGIPVSQKGAANGVATLDGTVHVPTAQIPATIVTGANNGTNAAVAVGPLGFGGGQNYAPNLNLLNGGGAIFGNGVVLRGVASYFHLQGGWQLDTGGNAFFAQGNFPLTGNLTVTGTKSFRIVDPADSTKYLTYVAVESPKVTVTDSGDGTLVGGEATITLDPTFSRVSEGALRAIVTPTGDCKGLYIASVAADRSSFTVRECQGGTSNVGFNWTAWATRLGYTGFAVVSDIPTP